MTRYAQRIAWPFAVSELPDAGGKAPPPLAPAKLVGLDEAGRAFSSLAFADLLRGWRDDGVREARFLIGAADGLSPQERAGVDVLMSFGIVTWPHLLVRAMLAEQLYRAATIIAGHPYHREG